MGIFRVLGYNKSGNYIIIWGLVTANVCIVVYKLCITEKNIMIDW